MYASLGRLGKAVPPDEDVPSLLVQLNHAAAQANVDFRSVELKLDEAAQAPGAAAARARRRVARRARRAERPARAAPRAPRARPARTESSGSATVAPRRVPEGSLRVQVRGRVLQPREADPQHRRARRPAQPGARDLGPPDHDRGLRDEARQGHDPRDQLHASRRPGPVRRRNARRPRRTPTPPRRRPRRPDPRPRLPPTAAVTAHEPVERQPPDRLPGPRRAAPVARRPRARDRADRDPGAAVELRVGHRRDARRRPTPPAAPATGSGGSLPAFQPVVSTEGSKSSEIRKNLKGFDTKDPFKVQGLPTGGGSRRGAAPARRGVAARHDHRTGAGTTTGTTAAPDRARPDPGSTGSSGDSTGQSGNVTYYTWTATVRFGIGDEPRQEAPGAVPRAAQLREPRGGLHGRDDGRRDRGVPGVRRHRHDRRRRLRARRHLHLPLHEGRRDAELRGRRRQRPGRHLQAEADRRSTSRRPTRRRAPARAATPRPAPSAAQARQRIARDRRDEGFAPRIDAVGF